MDDHEPNSPEELRIRSPQQTVLWVGMFIGQVIFVANDSSQYVYAMSCSLSFIPMQFAIG